MPTDIIDAATKGDLAVVLAIGLVTLAGAVTFLFRLILKLYGERVAKAEELVKDMLKKFDGLEEATKMAVAIARDNADIAKASADLAQKSLDELRRR